MIRWWIAMIIGIVTMCIGYYIGWSRAKGIYRMAEELIDRAGELQEKTKELLELIDEQQD